ncbi:hypothetical protein Plhal304r1_c042g0120701 [Plasmopara halstedii]
MDVGRSMVYDAPCLARTAKGPMMRYFSLLLPTELTASSGTFLVVLNAPSLVTAQSLFKVGEDEYNVHGTKGTTDCDLEDMVETMKVLCLVIDEGLAQVA